MDVHASAIEYSEGKTIARMLVRFEGGEWEWLTPEELEVRGLTFDRVQEIAELFESAVARMAADLDEPHNEFGTTSGIDILNGLRTGGTWSGVAEDHSVRDGS